MANRTTGFHTAHAAGPFRDSTEDAQIPDFAAETMTESLPAFLNTVSLSEQMEVDSRSAQIQNALSQPKLSLSDEEAEFQRLKKAEERAHRIQKMKKLRKRKRQK